MSVFKIQVDNNRNDYSRYFLGVRGVRLIKVSFKVNKEKNFGPSATVRLIEGVRLIRCPHNTGFTVFIVLLTERLEMS